jgi:2'-5' RNA ligase
MEQITRIFPHPVRGDATDVRSERIVHLPSEIRAAEGSTEERPILRIVSTSGREDRHGSKIRLAAWRTETYMRTGHVLWQHDAVPAYPYVGKTLSLTNEGDKSVAEIELLVKAWRHMSCNLPAFIFETFRDNGMGAISRGFIPLDLISMRATTIPTELAENVEYTDVEMTEQSFVNVPSNRDSFARGIDRAKTRGVMNDHLAKLLGFDVEPYVIETRGAQMSKLERTRAFRGVVAGAMKRCGVEPYYPTKPAFTPEQQESDLASLRSVVAGLVPLMESSLEAFKTTTNESLRSFFSSIAVNCIYNLESLLWRAKEWYGVELEIDDGLTDESGDVANIIEATDALAMSRSLPADLRAGAVFSRKNLEKIDQVISLMGDLRSAATKPTADDVPDEERGIPAETRMSGPFEYGSTQVNIEGEAKDAILALGAKIPDEALAEKGREADVHVTVKFGLDKEVTAEQVAAALDNEGVQSIGVNGGTITLGAVAMFEAEGYDVVYVGVDSPDLVTLNKIISEALPVTDTHPEYVPHVTLAYVIKGQGAALVESLGNELSGTTITFDAIAFSDTEGNMTEIPLAGEGSDEEPAADQPAGEEQRGIRVVMPEPQTLLIHVNDSGAGRSEQRSDDLITVLVPDASHGRSDESSNNSRPFYVSLLAD